MTFNYNKEKKAWNEWKSNEEKQLRDLGVKEDVIQKLHSYDKEMFNAERTFKLRQQVTDEKYFIKQPAYDQKDVDTLASLLNQIENEVLYEMIKKTDPITFAIMDLKLQGYSVKEISEILDLSIFAIYKRIRKFREKFLKEVKK